MEEIEASSTHLRPHLANFDSDLLRAAGPAYGISRSMIEGDPENHWQEWLALFLPQLVYNNPQCAVDSSRIEWEPARAGAIEYALNDWAPMIDLRHDLERCAIDFSFRWCVGVVQPEPVRGYEDAADPPYLPGFTRISPHDFRWDATVGDWRKARWLAHRVVLDIEDVIEEAENDPDADWDLKALEQIQTGVGPDPQRLSRQYPRMGNTPERHELVIWELWARDYRLDNAPKPEKGYFGTVFTVLDKAHHDTHAPEGWIRKPRPAYNPRGGPYCIQGSMLLGDMAAPLSPLVATTPQAVYLNRIARAILQAVEDYKRGIITNNAALAQSIIDDDDLTVYSADGVDVRQMIQQFAIGGVDQQLLVAKEDARQTLDRNSGLNEPTRGNVTGVATATEVERAFQSTTVRMGFIVEKFRDFVRQVYAHSAFYFDLDPDVVLDVGPLPIVDDQGRQLTGEIRGGAPKGRKWNALDHEHLGLRIDPYSMQRTDEQQKMVRFELMNVVLDRVVSLGPQSLFIDWDWYLRQASEATGVRDLERLVDTEMLNKVAAAVMQMQQAQPAHGKQSPQPRFAWNTAVTQVGRIGPKRDSQPQSHALRKPGAQRSTPRAKAAGAA